MATAVASRPTQSRLPTWIVVTLGVIAILLGLFMVFQPVAGAFALVVYLGISWLISGIVDLGSLFWDRTQWGWKVLNGVIGVWAGLAVLSQPLLSTLLVPWVFVIIIGITGIIGGVARVVQAFQGGGWGVGILGACWILLSVYLLMEPLAGAAVLPLVLGTIAIAGGVAACVAALTGR